MPVPGRNVQPRCAEILLKSGTSCYWSETTKSGNLSAQLSLIEATIKNPNYG